MPGVDVGLPDNRRLTPRDSANRIIGAHFSTPMGSRFALRSFLVIAGCSALIGLAGSSAESADTIRISGSSTVFPITKAAIQGFRTTGQGKSVDFDIKETGSTAGFREFCSGNIPLANASRPISGKELKRCAENGIPRPITFCFPGFSHNLSAVEVLMTKKVFTFARRGIRPEFEDGGRGGLGPAYNPKLDHPLLVPTTWYSGPESGTDDLKKAVAKAKDGKITVLCYHGVPAIEHPWVNTDPEVFKEQLQFLKDHGCTVIAMRDLRKYVDPTNRPEDPYAQIEERKQR